MQGAGPAEALPGFPRCTTPTCRPTTEAAARSYRHFTRRPAAHFSGRHPREPGCWATTAAAPCGKPTSLWLFSDTFFGTWGANGGRQITGAIHSSSALVELDDLETCFAGATYDGDPPAEVLIHPPGENTSTTAGWLEDTFFVGSALWSYYAVYTSTGPDPLDLQCLGIGVLPAQGAPPKFMRSSPDAFLFSGTEPTFGTAVTVLDGFVYAFGEASAPSLSPDVLLARVPTTSLANRSAYEFLAGLDSSLQPIWRSDVAAARALYSGGVNSVTFDAHLGRFLALSTPPFANTIQARVASNPWGPWSTVEEIIACYPNTDSQVYCYDAHRHPELESADGRTLVLTYDTNTSTFDELSEPSYSEVYWPRLVKVTFEQ